MREGGSPLRCRAVTRRVDGVEGLAFFLSRERGNLGELRACSILVRNMVSDCKTRLSRRFACNLLDVHASAAHRERLFRVQGAATRAQRGRSRANG